MCFILPFQEYFFWVPSVLKKENFKSTIPTTIKGASLSITMLIQIGVYIFIKMKTIKLQKFETVKMSNRLQKY